MRLNILPARLPQLEPNGNKTALSDGVYNSTWWVITDMSLNLHRWGHMSCSRLIYDSIHHLQFNTIDAI